MTEASASFKTSPVTETKLELKGLSNLKSKGIFHPDRDTHLVHATFARTRHGEAIGALTRSAHRYHRSTRKADGEGTSLGVIADGRSASFTAACPGAACG